MTDYDSLKTRAEQVRDEQTIGGNTALRVGQLLYDMVDNMEGTDNKTVFYLDSMGEELDDTSIYIGPGMVFYDPDAGVIKTCVSPGVYNITPCVDTVIYCNKATNILYRWSSASHDMIQIAGDGVATLVVGNVLNGQGDVLGMSGAMQIKANIDILAASLNRLYAKLGNIAFWTAQDQEDAEPTPIDWSIPKVVLTITNSITHGVVKYNGNVVSGSIQVDQGTTVNLLVEGETGYGISSAAATGATVVDNGNGTFTVSVKVDSTMSLTITGTAAALVTPSFVCSNDADALSLTGASAAVGGTFVGTIAIEDDYFDGFTIESVKDGSDNDVTYTTSGNTITVANMPSVLVITAKATKVLKFYADKSISGMGSVSNDSGRCFTDYIRLDGLTSSAVLNWVHKIDYDATKNRAIVFYDKNKKHMMNWNSDNYKDCPYHFIVNSTGSRQIAANSLATMLSHAGGLAYVRACFDLNDGAMNSLNALTQGSSSWLDPSNTESADDLVVHNITYSLTGCTTNASSATTSHPARTNIIDGENFQDTINVGSGKTLQSVVVTMDGVDITSTVYNSSTKKIVIASVTGALVITANAS